MNMDIYNREDAINSKLHKKKTIAVDENVNEE